MLTDPFSYLHEDEERISEHLNDTVDHFADAPRDQIFAEVKDELAALRVHFDKENLLISNLHDTSGTEQVLAEAKRQREAVLEEADNLTMIHIDEPGFEDGLHQIAEDMAKHHEFCSSQVLPKLRDKMNDREKKKAQDEFDRLVQS